MSQFDKTKWNKKYNENSSLLEKRDHSKLLEKAIKGVNKEKALDLACGSGRNSIYLASLGFNVLALDISDVAIDNLKKRDIQNIQAQVADLDNFSFENSSFNLITMTNFLDRELINRVKNSLKENGVFFIETYMEDKGNEKESSNPNYLLKKDELKSIFKDGFKILDYQEFFNESYEIFRMKKQAIIARKI